MRKLIHAKKGSRVFDMILDDSYSNSEGSEKDGERIQRTGARNHRKTRKRTKRRSSMDPSSKISQKLNRGKSNGQKNGAIPSTSTTKRDKRPNMTSRKSHRSSTQSTTIDNMKDQVIRPSSCHRTRLEFIVGKPVDRYLTNDGNDLINIRTRFVKKMIKSKGEHRELNFKKSDSDSDSECASSIATVSDLDKLEAKALRRRYPPKVDGKDLNLLRQEINKIVHSSIEERESEGNIWPIGRSIIKRSSFLEDELRQDYEGCTSNGCVYFLEDGVGREMQGFISGMKEYWIG